MAFIPTEDPRVDRDSASYGLVATNVLELKKNRSTRTITKRLDRVEKMLHDLTQQVSILAAQLDRTTTGRE